jgi:hypothetical protein
MKALITYILHRNIVTIILNTTYMVNFLNTVVFVKLNLILNLTIEIKWT